MTWAALISKILDILPPAVIAFLIPVCIGIWAHYSKRIKWKIVKTGVNGSTNITADMLKANCEQFHVPLDLQLKSVDHRLTEIRVTTDTIRERQGEVVESIAEIKGFIKGKFQ